jgi:hypothetical protein
MCHLQVKFALQNLEQTMAWDEAMFGRHFDLVRRMLLLQWRLTAGTCHTGVKQ